jgi:hypothetical protein
MRRKLGWLALVSGVAPGKKANKLREAGMKKFAWVGLAFALFVIPSHAQQYSAADVAAGYSYLHVGGVDGATGTNMNGGSGSVGLNVSNSDFR